MKSKDLQYRIEYILFRFVYHLARLLPRRAALALGAGLGLFMQLALPGRYRCAAANLRQVFPELSQGQLKATLRESFRHLGIIGVDMLRLDLYRDEQCRQRYLSLSGMEHLEEAFALGKGVFLMTGHLGFWEVGNILLPALGFPVDFVYKQIKNPYIEACFLALREAGGSRGIEKKRAARKIMRSLAQNRGVAILIDQRVGPSDGIQVDFFGRPANTTPVITEMAMRLGVPVVPVYCYRGADNRYHITVEPMLQFANVPEPAAVVANTLRLNRSLEQAIRRNVPQWFWLHDRWRR